MRDALVEQGPFEQVIHLGDGVLNGKDVSGEFNIPFIGVAGNEDIGSGFPQKQVVQIREWSFLLMHGHQTEINPYQLEELWEENIKEMCGMAKRAGSHVLLFGHTHKPLLIQKQGIILCNPGNHHLGSVEAPTFAFLKVSDTSLDIHIMEKKDTWRLLKPLSVTYTRSQSSHIHQE
jgi:putative phosphoesterase